MSLADDSRKAAFNLAARHWRLWEWLNGKATRIVKKSAPFQPTSLQSLWTSINRGEILADSFLELKINDQEDTYWYIQEWVPRAPGSLWLEDNLLERPLKDITASLSLGTCPEDMVDNMYTPHMHWETQYRAGASLEQQGFSRRLGTYRPPLSEDPDKYVLMAVVTAKEFLVDLGFPILVTQEVFNKIKSYQVFGCVQLEAMVEIRELQLSDPFRAFIQAAGVTENRLIADLINAQIGSRNLIGYIASPLDVTVRYHNTHPLATLRIEGHNSDEASKRDGIIVISRSMVANPVDIKDLPLIMNRNDFLLGPDEQFGTEMTPVTDFDGRIRRFICSAPIEINPKDDMTPVNNIRSVIET